VAKHICPWWLGYLLASPMRRWMLQSPEKLLAPYALEGMTILEPGPGMGFFTVPLARMVGANGRVVTVDVQPKMLEGLRRRARRAGLLSRIETRLVPFDSMQIDDLNDAVDFVLAFAMVHELPLVERFFAETVPTLRMGGLMLLAEPAGHVTSEAFENELAAARKAGLEVVARPVIRRSLAAVLRKI